MDSEDSRDASSGSESGDEKGRRSRSTVKSAGGDSNKSRSRSSTRSSSPPSRTHSASSRASADSRPQSPDDRSRASSNANSTRSRSPDSQSPEDKSRSSKASSPFTKSAKGISPEPESTRKSSSKKMSRSSSPDGRSSRSKSPEARHSSARSPDTGKDGLSSSHSIRNKSPDSPAVRSQSGSPAVRSQSGSPAMIKSPVHSSMKSDKAPSPRSKSPDVSNNRSDSVSSSSDEDSPKANRRNVTSLGTRHKSRERGESKPSSPQPPRSPSSQSSRSSSPGSPHRGNLQQQKPANDNMSVKSGSSSSSRQSRFSRGSRKSVSSRGSRRMRKRSDDISSDSSDSSVDSSSRKNKNIVKAVDTQPEEISDGDIESDQEKDDTHSKTNSGPKPEINISHEDLSDVSDLEDSMGAHSENEVEHAKEEKANGTLNKEERISSPEIKKVPEKTPRPEEGEEQLDFEAEDGECEAEPTTKTKDDAEEQAAHTDDTKKTEEKVEEKAKEEKEELEEGEVTDEDDVRPEETEPRPVCRFFSRGQCTWGASCRFLHPGVTDKGNYTMFDLIRPMVPGEFRDDRLFGKIEPPVVESAWERGLRTAKEMLRKSVKRKEQDIDFEEKKMNLSLAQEEFDKENGYYGRVTSPEPRYVRHVTAEYPVSRPPPEEYFGRRQVVYEPEYAVPVPVPSAPPARERVRSYRELPSHRMPDFYNNKYEEEQPPQHASGAVGAGGKRSKPKREVIVQRAEERPGRGDEWSDPWMRSKSPAGRRKEPGRKRSYSSGSSYSSSSSSDSSRSSYRSRSRSVRRRRSRSRRGRQVSPSVIVSERKAANERAALMNPPAPKRRAPSPGMMRVSGAANPPAPSREDQFGRRSKLAVAAALARVKGRRSSKSSSGSSGSSSSDSDSSDSSSSSSRDGSPAVRRPAAVELVKAMDALKGGALEKKQIKLNLKNPVGAKKSESSEFSRKVESSTQGKKRPASSPPPGESKSKKATSRREELLKQLKAVEDAIAKKRSKV